MQVNIIRGVVWVEVLFNKETKHYAEFMQDFAHWTLDNNVYPVAHGSSVSLGISNGYIPEDATKLLTWLAEIENGS